MGLKVAKFCIILLVSLLFGRATKAVSNNHFWSVEIPANGTAKTYLQRDYIYHITKAEFNFPRSGNKRRPRAGQVKEGITWAKVILHESSIDGGWRQDIVSLKIYFCSPISWNLNAPKVVVRYSLSSPSK